MLHRRPVINFIRYTIVRGIYISLLFLLLQSGRAYCAAPAYQLYIKGDLTLAASAYLALAAATPENPRPLLNAAASFKQAGR